MMEHSIDILHELKQITPFLSAMKKVNVFSVPQGYFTNLDKQILENIFIQPALLLPTSETQNLGVPEGYFDNLAGNILKKIKTLTNDAESDELRQHYPLLYTLRNENVFSLPKNYFEQLPANILTGVKPQELQVIHIRKRTVWNYAVAATITGLMAISSLLVTTNNNKHPIANQVGTNLSIPSYIQDSYQYKNEEQINEGITKLSNDDIIKYLEATGNDADNEAFASGVTEKELPSQEDYLLNEKTLDKYLNQN
jgi:hypothetical protein